MGYDYSKKKYISRVLKNHKMISTFLGTLQLGDVFGTHCLRQRRGHILYIKATFKKNKIIHVSKKILSQ